MDCDGDGEADDGISIEGGKTGFTDEAKYTLSTILDDNGHTYICVTTKSKDELKAVEDQIAIYENIWAARLLIIKTRTARRILTRLLFLRSRIN